MPPLSNLIVFVPVALVMAFTPGPATLFVLGRATAHGRRAGLLSAAGLLSGTLALVGCASVGLTRVLEASPVAFAIVRNAGAAYLIYLGVRACTAPGGGVPAGRARADARPWWRLYRDGVVTELLNPKAALFYASVLPQFVDARRADVALQMVALGVVFALFASISLALIALCAGAVASRLERYPASLTVARWTSGAVLVGLGMRLAVSRTR